MEKIIINFKNNTKFLESESNKLFTSSLLNHLEVGISVHHVQFQNLLKAVLEMGLRDMQNPQVPYRIPQMMDFELFDGHAVSSLKLTL